jgi:site-specific recombinase XerD
LRPREVDQLRRSLDEERRDGVSRGHPKPVRDAAIIETLIGTGLRVTEACLLRVGDLYLDGDHPSVFVRRGKGGRQRLVPISSRLGDYLREFLSQKQTWGQSNEREQPLFLGEHGVALTRWGITKIWKSALARAGLPPKWGVHSTRHTFAVEAYRQTRDLRLVQRLLGHASPVTTMAYAALLDEDVRAGVERIWG